MTVGVIDELDIKMRQLETGVADRNHLVQRGIVDPKLRNTPTDEFNPYAADYNEELHEAAQARYLTVYKETEQRMVHHESESLRILKRMASAVGFLQKSLTNAMINIDKLLRSGTLLLNNYSEEFAKSLQQCIDPIVDYDGMLTVENREIWGILSGESVEYYTLFKKYLEMEGKRSLYFIIDSHINEEIKLAIPYLYTIYQWQLRVKAFDDYREQQRISERIAHREKMEIRHREACEKLFDESLLALSSKIPMMDSDQLIKAATFAAKLERVSVGLPADKPIESGEIASQGNKLVQVNIQNNTVETAKEGTKAETDGGRQTDEILTILQKAGAFVIPEEVEEVEEADSLIDIDAQEDVETSDDWNSKETPETNSDDTDISTNCHEALNPSIDNVVAFCSKGGAEHDT